jgi:threonine synthase
MKEIGARISSLKCSDCERAFSINQTNTYASCDKCKASPLITLYNLHRLSKEAINSQERSLWRYFEVLPILNKENIISLGEGWTPLIKLDRLANQLEIENLLLKDESLNPTGSFKARGLSVAISKVKELGLSNCIVPTAGNAGGAMAAYCAKAEINATVIMPRHTPNAFQTECQYFGATLILVDGLISDCAKKVAELNRDEKYFDLSTMKEPYRLEGKKTLGYEIAEQLNWSLPDVILYPTGGGTGLIGMWKAFNEMIQAGWIDNKLPRFVAVQSENCRPVVDFFHDGKTAPTYNSTIANGLAVPFPFAHRLIQQVLHETNGHALAVSEMEIIQGMKELAVTEGILAAPEGGALLPALKKLLAKGVISRESRVLLLNTGSGYKYLENLK